jgi:hypothetical protein
VGGNHVIPYVGIAPPAESMHRPPSSTCFGTSAAGSALPLGSRGHVTDLTSGDSAPRLQHSGVPSASSHMARGTARRAALLRGRTTADRIGYRIAARALRRRRGSGALRINRDRL